MKRAFDLFFAFVGLIILFPGFVVAGIAITILDKGPVIFKQERIGKNGKPFILYKFRTMTVDKTAGKGRFDAGDISRVTPTGRFLRRTKIDELPQIINVLKGDMSFVGPRPEIKKWVLAYPERWQKILTVSPGITDNASIEFRCEEELLAQTSDPEGIYRQVILPRKLQLYENYVDHHSLSGDLKLIFKTLYCCLFQKNEPNTICQSSDR